ncbi:MAG: choice-of-anchor D domain-containing protein [Casimicrobiaceae bacterium]
MVAKTCRGALGALLLCMAGGVLGQSRMCIDRDTIVFGDRPVGSSASVTVTVANCGNAPFAFTDVSVHGATGPGYLVASACTTGQTLAPGAACPATITFAPTTAGQQSGALWLRNTTSTATQLVTFYGRGTTASAGASTLTFSPSPAQFADTVVGSSSAPLRIDLQNRGAVAITPSAIVFNGPAVFDFDNTGTCGVGLPIPPGGSCRIDVVFTPGAAGVRLANLNVDAPQLASLAIVRIAGTGVAAPVLPATAELVEYHHEGLDHYFLTLEPAEIAFLDASGLGPAWSRTGRRLQAWPLSVAVAGAVDACRFFGTPGVGPDSHFYTVNAAECDFVRHDRYWIFEGAAFAVLPLAGSSCPSGSDVVQRLFKPADDVTGIRHRYVVAAADIAAMRLAGWLVEGPVFCSPKVPTG